MLGKALAALSLFALAGQGSAQASAMRGQVTAAQLDTFRLFAQYTAAAYCNAAPERTGQKIVCSDDACPLIAAHDTTIVTTHEDGKDRTGGYIAVDNTTQMIVVAFHGTITASGYVADLTAALKDDDLCEGCKTHTGFQNIWNTINQTVLSTVEDLHRAFPDYQIVTTGHSMGAALATLAGAHLRQQLEGVAVDVYSLGSPRVGNRAFAEFASAQRPGRIWRITHGDDPVPRLPPRLLGYFHTDTEYWLATGDARTLDYGPDDVLVCEGVFNKNCNTGSDFVGIDFPAHTRYLQEIGACKP